MTVIIIAAYILHLSWNNMYL